jgi:hypothetical protein
LGGDLILQRELEKKRKKKRNPERGLEVFVDWEKPSDQFFSHRLLIRREDGELV